MGFRFTVQDIARELGVCGWVKNLSDARVELVAEAEEEILKIFLEKINHYFSRYIQDTEMHWLAATDEFKEFALKF